MAVEPRRGLEGVLPGTLNNRPTGNFRSGQSAASQNAGGKNRLISEPIDGYESAAPRGTYIDILI